MRTHTWLRRTSWPLALGMTLLTGTALAQDQPPPRDPPPPHDGPAPPDAPPPPHGPRDVLFLHRGAPGAQFGIAVVPLPKPLATQLKLKDEGVLVIHVRKDSAAEKAGVKEDDVLLSIDDKPVKEPHQLVVIVEDAPEKERTLKLLRTGEKLDVKVTPEKLPDIEAPGFFDKRIHVDGDQMRIDIREIRELEKTIRDKVRDAGVDLRMQFIEPGAFLPRGANFVFQGRRTDLPEDLSITIRKKGKEPADVEVKKGEQSWTVKENDLAPLPDEVRKDVEGYLGHAPMKFSIVHDGEDGPGPRPHHPDGPPRPPRGPGDDEFGPPPGRPDRPDGPGPGGPEVRRGPRPPRGPEGPDGPGHHEEHVELHHRAGPGGPGGGLEHRLEEMARRMEQMQRQLEGLRHRLGDDDDHPRARRPERPAPPEDDGESDDK